MYLIFLIILIILIIIYNILWSIKIENFYNYNKEEVQFELTPTNNEIVKFDLVSYNNNNVEINKKILIYGVPIYIYEIVDMPNSDSIYAVFSSYVLNTNSKNSSGKSLLATTKSSLAESVALKDNGFGLMNGFNYIFFNFPDEIKTNIFTKFEITFANKGGYDARNFIIVSFNNSSLTNKISLDTLIKLPITKMNKGVNQTLTFIMNVDFIMENANLLLLVSNDITELDISSIKIYFKTPIIKTDIDKSLLEKSEKITLKMTSSNENEQIDLFGFNLFFPQDEEDTEDGKLYSTTGIMQTLNLLLKLRVPWGVYDASTVYQNNTSVIIEQLKGGCKNATISGSSSLEKDNIYYIKGNANTCIEFPEGSMPSTYTICAITKYVNPTSNNYEILKSAYNPKIAIGHANNTNGIVTKNDFKMNTSFKNSNPNNTDWVITCIKSNGKNVKKTIIINNEQCGFIKLENLQNNNKLIINSNTLNKNNCSDFGFSYLIIWDQLLTDNELVMVSKVLNNYVIDTTRKIDIDRTVITMKDGSSIDKAANSAIDIRRNFCVNNNGRYWIKPPGEEKAELVFCIMDEKCKGGGWMLAMKGSKYDYKTFHYDSPYWTTNNTLIPSNRADYDFEQNSDLMETELDAKYNIYNTYKAKECLAIFDPRDFNRENNPGYYYDFNNLKKYGWMWHENKFNNGVPITLLNFFQTNKSQFYYTAVNKSNRQSLINFMNANYDASLVKYLGYDDVFNGLPEYRRLILYDNTSELYVNTNRDPSLKGPCHLNIWSSQREFYSFGFNVGPIVNNRAIWPHKVRWGASFNENEDSKPTSNDVSGGIGMECRRYSAGDGISCCQSKTGVNRHFSFKWFIR